VRVGNEAILDVATLDTAKLRRDAGCADEAG
jgi:hypothetical protein